MKNVENSGVIHYLNQTAGPTCFCGLRMPPLLMSLKVGVVYEGLLT